MNRNEEILASVSAADPNLRANYQGMLGYWCQAEAVFIETLRPEPGEAIAKYRATLAAGSVAVGHNTGIDALLRLKLLARLSTVEAANTELKLELAEQQTDKLTLVQQNQSAERLIAELKPWARFYRDGLTIGEILAENGDDWRPVGPVLRSIGRNKEYLPDSQPAPQEVEAAAGPGELEIAPLQPTYPTELFYNQAEYDAMVADVVRRVESGEITPRDLELAGLTRCDLCDESPCGMCPHHAPKPESQSGEVQTREPDEAEREIIGTYEVSGLPVYEGDDYVTDVEGCYLTCAEANELGPVTPDEDNG